MKTVQEKIAIMQAYVDGKKIETRRLPHNTWELWKTINGDPKFDWVHCDYRIAEDYELKAYNLYPGHAAPRIADDTRKWMRAIINAVKAGEIQ